MGEKQEGATSYLGRFSAWWKMAGDELSAVAVVEAAMAAAFSPAARQIGGGASRHSGQ